MKLMAFALASALIALAPQAQALSSEETKGIAAEMVLQNQQLKKRYDQFSHRNDRTLEIDRRISLCWSNVAGSVYHWEKRPDFFEHDLITIWRMSCQNLVYLKEILPSLKDEDSTGTSRARYYKFFQVEPSSLDPAVRVIVERVRSLMNLTLKENNPFKHQSFGQIMDRDFLRHHDGKGRYFKEGVGE